MPDVDLLFASLSFSSVIIGTERWFGKMAAFPLNQVYLTESVSTTLSDPRQ